MSDFLLSRRPNCSSQLAQILGRVTWLETERIRRFDGPWGSLAVTPNAHRGYEPLRTQREIAIVIGGPLPKVPGVHGPEVADENRGTATIAKRFLEEKSADWHSDLLAPCCFLHIDLQSHEVTVVTDEMSFIPVYAAHERGLDSGRVSVLSTHPDAAALHASGDGDLAIDAISACDLVMHRVITYPHTLHENVRELPPGSVHRLRAEVINSNAYWRPVEVPGRFRQVGEAAQEARDAVLEVIERAAEYYGRLGILLSAGEDSRTVACMVPRGTPLHCFTFARCDNREVRTARRVAEALGAAWEPIALPEESYLENIGRRSLFAGSSSVGSSVHFTGLLARSRITSEPVVLGGFKSDTFLKGHYVRVRNVVRGLPYQVLDARERKEEAWEPYFPKEVIAEVLARKARHRAWVREALPNCADRWIPYWPMSQDHEIGHYWSNRRMFASLEVFMTGRVLDLAASVPVAWTLNRRLFQKMAGPYLRRLWWIPHGDGHLPAFPWYINLAIQPVLRTYWALRLGAAHRSQGSWPSQEQILQSPRATELAQRVLPRAEQLGSAFAQSSGIVRDTSLRPYQRYAYLQILSMLESFDQLREHAAAV